MSIMLQNIADFQVEQVGSDIIVQVMDKRGTGIYSKIPSIF